MTLTETAAFTKKALVFAALFFVFIFILWGGYAYYKAFIYKPPVIVEKPDLKFGILPKPNLPASKTPSSGFAYSMDTETGGVPTNTPKLFKVYSVAQLATDLLALDRAKNLAFSLGFNRTPQMLTSTEYRFLAEKGGELIVDLDTGNFKFEKPIATISAQESTNKESFLNPDRLGQQFKNYLAQKDLLKDQLKEGQVKVSYNDDRQTAEVSLWQEDIDKIPIVSDSFSKGLIRSITTQSIDEQRKYILLDYVFWPIDKDNAATYPIKKAEDAFNELKDGSSTVIVEPKASDVSITKVYLAYLLSRNYSPYLQPVYVFEGDNFAAYVPAITSEYLEN